MLKKPLWEQFALCTVQLQRRGSHRPDPEIWGIFNTNRKKYNAWKVEYNTWLYFLDVLLRSLFTSFWKSLTWMAGRFSSWRHWNLSQVCFLIYFEFFIFRSLSPGLSEVILFLFFTQVWKMFQVYTFEFMALWFNKKFKNSHNSSNGSIFDI